MNIHSVSAFLSLAKQRTRELLLLACLLTPLLLPAQVERSCASSCSCDMAGRVVDQHTKQPLAYATVKLKGTSTGTFTDEEGVFHLHNLCDDEFDLEISYLGYKTVVHHHDLYHTDPVIFLSAEDAQLESIVIEEQALESGQASATISSISGRELQNQRGERLGDVLSKLSGVSTLSTGQNIVKPVVHGLHSSRILIINNGVRHESQSWGAEHAPEIDPAMAGSLQLIKGAATVKYGPGALGGVILVEPPQPSLTTPFRGGADLTLQSNGLSATSSVYAQQGYSSFAWFAQASGLYQGDLHTPHYQLSNTGAREMNVAAGVLYHRGRLDLHLHYSYVGQKLGILRGSVVGNLSDLAQAMRNEPPAYTSGFSYQIGTPYQQVGHHLLKVKATHSLPRGSLHLQYAFQANHRQELDVRRGTNNEIPSIDLELFTHAMDAEWKHPAYGRFTGSVGIQGQYQQNNNLPGTNTTPFLPNYNNLSLGIYLIETAQLGKSIADAGLRLDLQTASVRGRNSNNEVFADELRYSSITASTGLLHPLTGHSSLQTNLGMAWRPPNMAELYSFGKHETAVEWGLRRQAMGQEGQSELSYKWVTTYLYEKHNLSLELTAYANYLQHYIYARPAGITTTVRGAFPFYVYDQTDALLAGLDASLSYRHSASWESDLRGMWLHATDAATGNPLVGIPPNRLSYSLEYRLDRLYGLKNLTAGLEAAYVFRQYRAPQVITPESLLEGSNDQGESIVADSRGFELMAAPEGYPLFHLHTGLERGRFGLRLAVRNLLNTAYRQYTNRQRYFADEPGRNFSATVKYTF